VYKSGAQGNASRRSSPISGDGQSGVFFVWTEYAQYAPALGWTGGDIQVSTLRAAS
jgi:hypothetical protein